MSVKITLSVGITLFVSSVLSASTITPNTTQTPTPTTHPTTSHPATGTTTPQATQGPASVCDELGKDQCCNTSGCAFFTCKNLTVPTEDHTGCHKVDANLTALCVANTSQNTCNATQTTQAPSTQAPTTTPAVTNPPTTQSVEDQCASLTEKTNCCNSTDTLACKFITCQTSGGQPHEGCHANATDVTSICSSDTKDLCLDQPSTAAPTTTPQATGGPTDKPSTTGTNNTSTTQANSGGNPDAQSGDKGHKQSFDAPSFVGGMVLVAGLFGIIFFGLKFYKARTERNYHTL